MKKLFKFLTVLTILSGGTAFAQVGLGTTTPDASAMLDVASTTKGLLVPRHTTTTRGTITLPAKGLLIFNTTTNQFETNTGTTATPVWTAVGANSSLYATDGTTTGTRTVTLAANPLSFTSTATNGFSVDGTTFSVDAANNRVGIGTAAPTQSLHISGGNGLLNGQVAPVLRLQSTIDASVAGDASNVNKGAFLEFTPSDDTKGIVLKHNNLAFGGREAGLFIQKKINATTYEDIAVFDQTNKRFGIGVLNPSEKLEVVGNVKFSGALMPNNAAGTTGQVLTSAGAGAAPTWTTISSTSVTGTAPIAVTSGVVSLSDSGITSAKILDGTIASGDIADNAVTVAKLPTGATATTFLRGDGTWATPASSSATASNGLTATTGNVKLGGAISEATTISGLTATNKLAITATGVDAINLDSNTLSVDATNDRIGIGTTTPKQKLDVSGYAKVTGITNGDGTLTTSDLGLYNQNSGNWSRYVTNAGSHAWYFDGSSTNSYSGTTPALILKETGNLGIGTLSPSEKLDVTGSAKVSANLNVDGTTFNVDATNNKVGIGTAAPSQKLVVIGDQTTTASGAPATTGTTSNALLRLKSGSVGGEILEFGSNVIDPSSSYSWIDATNADNLSLKYKLALNPNGGNVGIGKVDPSEKLDVNGNVKFSGALMPNNTAGTTGQVLTSAGANTAPTWITPVSASLPADTRLGFAKVYDASTGDAFGIEQVSSSLTGSGAATRMFTNNSGSNYIGFGKYTSTTAFTEFGRFNQSGNFGIANTSPSEKLDVTGNVKFSGALIAGSSSGNSGQVLTSAGSGTPTWTTPTSASLPSDTRLGFAKVYDASIGDAFGIEQVSSDQTGSGAATRMFTNNSGSNYIGFGKYTSTTAFTEFGRFNQSGNFGIANNAPSEKLDVTGNAKVSANLYVDGTTFNVDATNNRVGIGTDSPTEALHVSAGNVLLNGSTNPTIRLNSSSNTVDEGAVLEFTETNPKWGMALKHSTGDSATKAEGLYIRSKDDNVYTDLAVFDQINNRVGIGTTKPTSKLEVNGSVTNTSSISDTDLNIDFSGSNLAYTTASAGSIILSNIKDGGTYTLNLRGTTSGTSSFTASGFTIKPVNNGATTGGKETIYTFLVMGTNVYVYMVTGI